MNEEFLYYVRYENIMAFVNNNCNGKFSILRKLYNSESILNFVSQKYPPKRKISFDVARTIEIKLGMNDSSLDNPSFKQAIVDPSVQKTRVNNIRHIIDIIECGSQKKFIEKTGIKSISNYVGRNRNRNPGFNLVRRIEHSYGLAKESLDISFSIKPFFSQLNQHDKHEILKNILNKLDTLSELYSHIYSELNSRVHLMLELANMECQKSFEVDDTNYFDNYFFEPLKDVPNFKSKNKVYFFETSEKKSVWSKKIKLLNKKIEIYEKFNSDVEFESVVVKFDCKNNCDTISDNFYEKTKVNRSVIDYCLDRMLLLKKEIRFYFNNLMDLVLTTSFVEQYQKETEVNTESGFYIPILKFKKLPSKYILLPNIESLFIISDIKDFIINCSSNIDQIFLISNEITMNKKIPNMISRKKWLDTYTMSGENNVK